MQSQQLPSNTKEVETQGCNYDRVSWNYDATISFFTGGQNLATRLAQLDEMRPGDRVLYVGVGSAEDAIEAARRGIDVTCLDLSSAMIEKARARFARKTAGELCLRRHHALCAGATL